MVHNGVEYALMQAYAEGFRNANSQEICRSTTITDLTDIAEVWRRGSVVGSWLLLAMALAENPTLDNYSGYVEDSGEGRWTIMAAIESAVPVEVLSASLYARFRSRHEHVCRESIVSDALQVRWTCRATQQSLLMRSVSILGVENKIMNMNDTRLAEPASPAIAIFGCRRFN